MKSSFICFEFSLAVLFFLIIIFPSHISAQTCSGTYQCGTLITQCELSNGVPCTCQIDAGCFPVSTCDSNSSPKTCQVASCNDPSGGQCAAGACIVSTTCAWSGGGATPTSSPRCGDLNCDTAYGETQYNCPQDCGYPPTPTPTLPPPLMPSPCNATPSYSGGNSSVTFTWSQQQSGIDYLVAWTGSGGAHDAGVDSSSLTYSGFAPNTTISYGITPVRNGVTGDACQGTVTTASGPTAVPTSSTVCKVNSNYTCGSSAFSGNCTTSTGQAGTYQYQAGSYQDCTNPNLYCFQCVANSATPIPTSAPLPTPTTAPGGGTCSGLCATSTYLDGLCGSYDEISQIIPGTCPAGQVCGECVTAPTCVTTTCQSGGTSCCDGQVCNQPPGFTSGYCQAPCTGCQSLYYWCRDDNSKCGGGLVCSNGSCVTPTYSISGTVFKDSNGDGTQQTSSVYCKDADGNGICDDNTEYTNLNWCRNPGTNCIVKRGPEDGYQGVKVCAGVTCSTTSSTGSYSLIGLYSGSYIVSLNPVPSGYNMTPVSGNTNPRSVTVNANTTVNFALVQAPACDPPSITANPATLDPGGTSTLSVTSCTNIAPSPPTPFAWTPDTNGNTPTPSVGGQTDTTSSSTVTWDSPTNNCPVGTTNYNAKVNVLGSGSSTQYTKTISIKSNDVNVKVVTGTDASSCATGALYTGGDVRLNLSGTSVNNNSFSQNQIANAGTAKFTCVPDAKTTYDLTAVPPAGYSIINATNTPDAGTWTTGDSTISIPVKQTETATFCIAPINPWFQTDLGDVRFNRLNNPVPKGQTASTSTSYPGIFYSSDIDASFGDGNVSTKNWVVNNEDSYNTKTQNRNGSISYDFYKSKALKEAVSIIPIPDDGIVDVNSLKSGVYEATGTTGNITINSDTTITGKHIILLTKGTVTIKGNITVPSGGKGLFILASKDDMIVTPTVTNLDGYYSSQKDIAIQSTDPTCKTNTDQQLVVNGALISNALKPFANEPTGKINLQRTLCINNQSQPALKLNFRPDFLIQLTDFYKTTYTKWSEVNP